MIIYYDEYQHFRKELLEAANKHNYFEMANEPLAKEYYAEGIKEFPNLKMYQVGIEQFFCLNAQATEKVKKLIKGRINNIKTEIKDLNETLHKIEQDAPATERKTKSSHKKKVV